MLDQDLLNVIKDFGSNVFTNLVRNTFTGTYLKKFSCSDCKKNM
jgi:hypothetical protein